jgi:hypothetical protein
VGIGIPRAIGQVRDGRKINISLALFYMQKPPSLKGTVNEQSRLRHYWRFSFEGGNDALYSPNHRDLKAARL